MWKLKVGNCGCVYLDGDGGGVEENICDCEIWFIENYRLVSIIFYREGNDVLKFLVIFFLIF